MAKYKVLNAFDMGGVTQEVGTVVELTVEQVDNFGIANLEEVNLGDPDSETPEGAGATGEATSSGAVSGSASTSGAASE